MADPDSQRRAEPLAYESKSRARRSSVLAKTIPLWFLLTLALAAALILGFYYHLLKGFTEID